MKILQLCIRVPFPTSDGGTIAMYNMQKSLYINNATLKVLSFNTIKQPVDIEKLSIEYKAMTNIEAVFLDNRIRPFAALFNLFTGESYHIIRFIRRDFDEKLTKILRENTFDIIQLESLYMIPYLDTIRRNSSAKVVLRTHNIEHLIWQRLAKIAVNPIRRWYLNLLAERLRHYEMWAMNRIDAIVALTKEDQHGLESLGADVPIHIAPVGIDLKDYSVSDFHFRKQLFHLGAMDWLPNQEGMRWLLNEVWPTIQQQFPDATLDIAGKKMPKEFFAFSNKQCSITDFVPDAIHFMADRNIMLVPLFSGSGMRVKIIEGLALGKVIVTTSIGLEGIPATDMKHVMIANTKEEFIEKISTLFNNQDLCKLIGNEGRLLAEQLFNNQKIGRELIGFYEKL